MSLDRYPSNPHLDAFQSRSNDVFYFIFTFEMVIKMAGMGIKEFFKDHFNKFDCFIIVISTIDFILTQIIVSKSSSSL